MKKKNFFVLNKYQLVFRSVALDTKKDMGYFRFYFKDRTFFNPVTYPMH